MNLMNIFHLEIGFYSSQSNAYIRVIHYVFEITNEKCVIVDLSIVQHAGRGHGGWSRHANSTGIPNLNIKFDNMIVKVREMHHNTCSKVHFV